jgi:sigma-B regulation protein RsbU (phosphoserine phosphatase)
MDQSELHYLRDELERRRDTLRRAAAGPSTDQCLHNLLDQVDQALRKLRQGDYGLCQVCHEPIETDRLLVDPLVCVCLDHLSSDEKRTLENDLQLAAQIQTRLLPPRELTANGWSVDYAYMPAGVVSGDYCDLFESGDHIVFMLGDVTGKGVAASMLMSHLHATFRSLFEPQLPLGRILTTANRLFCESTLATHFATLVIGRLTPDGEVSLVNAGHPPVLWLRPDGVTPLESTSVPLGMFCDGTFTEQHVHLEGGERLILYSDGLTEAMNHAGEEYGIDRLTRFVAEQPGETSGGILTGCFRAVTAFAAVQRPRDDMSMMVVSRL